jgi:hypothetical protein
MHVPKHTRICISSMYTLRRRSITALSGIYVRFPCCRSSPRLWYLSGSWYQGSASAYISMCGLDTKRIIIIDPQSVHCATISQRAHKGRVRVLRTCLTKRFRRASPADIQRTGSSSRTFSHVSKLPDMLKLNILEHLTAKELLSVMQLSRYTCIRIHK